MNRLKKELKDHPHGKDLKEEDIRKIFEQAVMSQKPSIAKLPPKSSTDLKTDLQAQNSPKKSTVYSSQKLNQLDHRLQKTEENIKGFTRSIEQFCGLMKKEMTDVTKRLEDLKTKLIDQEKK